MVQLFEVQRGGSFLSLLAIALTPSRTIGPIYGILWSDRVFNKSNDKNEWCVLCLHFRLITFHFHWQNIPFAERIDWMWAKKREWNRRHTSTVYRTLMTERFDFKRTTPNNFSLKRDLKSKYGIVWELFFLLFRITIVGKKLYNLWWVDRNMSCAMVAE